jgi:hypothetical protein
VNNKIILAAILTITIMLPLGTVMGKPSDTCTTIKDGVLTYSAGHYLAGTPLMVGYDSYGYNYQGHMFKGSYANVYLGRDGFPPYEGDDDAYLAANPGAASKWYWPYRDEYQVNGKTCKWNYFTKIVAAPADAYAESGTWYTADDTEIGPVLWGSFATIQSVYNDPCDGYHGIEYLSPASAGFGYYKP